MKTTNIPFLGDCPRWDQDIPQDRADEFRTILGDVKQLILASASQRLLNLDDILRWHGILFARFVPLSCYAGSIRGDSHRCLAVDVQVAGVHGSFWQVTGAHLRHLAAITRRDLMELELNWAGLARGERALRLATTLANLVGGFIRIHPFINGNGRVSRLLWQWSLQRFGVPPQVPVHPRPDPPYAVIMAASMRGDLRYFVQHVLQHLAAHPAAIRSP